MNNPIIPKQPDIQQLFQQFKQNPMKYLTGLNVPSGMTSPQQIVQYLAANGKIPAQIQEQVKALMPRY